MSGYTTTPLNAIDIPAGVQSWVGSLRFCESHAWHWQCFEDVTTCRAGLLWIMNSANVAQIRINLYRGESTWPEAYLEMVRPHALAPWTCAQVPDWDIVVEERAAVAAAIEIIAQHQRAR